MLRHVSLFSNILPTKINVTHVKQIHWSEYLSSDSQLEAVAESQYNVAKIILARPSAIVVSEAVVSDYTPEIRNKTPIIVQNIKRYFPNGLPGTFTELNTSQKKLLAEVTGPIILFYLGLLDKVYKTQSEDEGKALLAKLPLYTKTGKVYPCERKIIFTERERIALRSVKEAAIKSKNSNVLLIFGKAHNFKSHMNADPDFTLNFAGEIDASPHHTRLEKLVLFLLRPNPVGWDFAIQHIEKYTEKITYIFQLATESCRRHYPR